MKRIKLLLGVSLLLILSGASCAGAWAGGEQWPDDQPGDPGAGTNNQLHNDNNNTNNNKVNGANESTNKNSNSSGANVDATVSPTLVNQSATESNSSSNSGNFGGAVRNNTNDNSGNSITQGDVIDAADRSTKNDVTVIDAKEEYNVDRSSSETYVVEESAVTDNSKSYNISFPSPPGTSKQGYVFSVSTGPRGVLNYQASCPTGGTSIGIGILFTSFTFADNNTKLPKACKDVQSTIDDVIAIKQGRDSAATLGRTYEVVLEQEVYYRTLRKMGFDDAAIDKKLQAVHQLRQGVANGNNKPKDVAQGTEEATSNQSASRNSDQDAESQKQANLKIKGF